MSYHYLLVSDALHITLQLVLQASLFGHLLVPVLHVTLIKPAHSATAKVAQPLIQRFSDVTFHNPDTLQMQFWECSWTQRKKSFVKLAYLC